MDIECSTLAEEVGEERAELMLSTINSFFKGKEILECWSNATKMRRWLMHKKQLISDKFEFQDDRETKEKERLTTIIEKVVSKAEFLCSVQLPAVAFKAGIANSVDNEDANTMTRKASLMRMTSSVAEEVFDLKKRVLPLA